MRKKLPSLPHATEWGRHKETTNRGPDGVLENFGQLKCLIPKDLIGRLKKKTIQKKAVMQVIKDFGLILLVLLSMTNARQKFIRLRNVC